MERIITTRETRIAAVSTDGAGQSAAVPAVAALVLAFAAVVFMIADLDRPTEGLLTISQQAMIDLRTTLQETTP
jgi:hypothetical protein